jgi:hypothetical protein
MYMYTYTLISASLMLLLLLPAYTAAFVVLLTARPGARRVC